METVPLKQAEVTDDSDIRNRLVDVCSLGPRLNSVSGPATLKSEDGKDGAGSKENIALLSVRGKNLCVQECSLNISSRQKLLKITRWTPAKRQLGFRIPNVHLRTKEAQI